MYFLLEKVDFHCYVSLAEGDKHCSQKSAGNFLWRPQVTLLKVYSEFSKGIRAPQNGRNIQGKDLQFLIIAQVDMSQGVFVHHFRICVWKRRSEEMFGPKTWWRPEVWVVWKKIVHLEWWRDESSKLVSHWMSAKSWVVVELKSFGKKNISLELIKSISM